MPTISMDSRYGENNDEPDNRIYQKDFVHGATFGGDAGKPVKNGQQYAHQAARAAINPLNPTMLSTRRRL